MRPGSFKDRRDQQGIGKSQWCSGKLVVLSLDLDIKQSFVICAILPGLLQKLDLLIVEFAADGLLELSSAYLLVGLFLLGSFVDRLEACLHAQPDGTSRASMVVGIGPDLDGLVVGGREQLVACCAYVEEKRVRGQQSELFFG